MKIYNSLTDKIEEFKPIEEGKVTMYVCGPTVYNYVHIGNMRPVITFDMVYNYLKYLGYDVKYASNYTDINPKITKAAKELSITEREVADKFIKAYEEDLKNYNCSTIDYRPRVRNYLEDIFNCINKLIEKDYAYVVDGDVYFRVSKIKFSLSASFKLGAIFVKKVLKIFFSICVYGRVITGKAAVPLRPPRHISISV